MHFLINVFQFLIKRPDAWAFVFCVPFGALVWALKMSRRPVFSYLSPLLGLLGAAILVVYIWQAWVYLYAQEFATGIEVQIASVSWYFMEGHPLYHDAVSSEMYSMLYGPYLYIFTGLFEWLLGPSFFSSRLLGFLAVMLSLALLAWILRRRLSWPVAIFGTSLLVVGIIALADDSLPLARPDCLLLFFVTASLWSMDIFGRKAFLTVCIFAALATDVKFHALLYFLPQLYLTWPQKRPKAVVSLATFCFVVVFAAPFLFWQNISLKNYLWIIKTIMAHGFDPHYFVSVSTDFAAMLLPVLAWVAIVYFKDPSSVRFAISKRAILILVLFGEFLLLIVPASKYGAGTHHLIPIAPVLIYIWADLLADIPNEKFEPDIPQGVLFALLGSWIICASGVAVMRNYQLGAWEKGRAAWAQSVNQDIASIIQRYGKDHTIYMGCGSASFYLPYFRPLLVFNGQPEGIDPDALDDFAYSDHEAPSVEALIGNTAKGKKPLWLIAKSETPFTAKNLYAPVFGDGYGDPKEIYTQQFRDDFSTKFVLKSSSQFYDLYELK